MKAYETDEMYAFEAYAEETKGLSQAIPKEEIKTIFPLPEALNKGRVLRGTFTDSRIMKIFNSLKVVSSKQVKFL